MRLRQRREFRRLAREGRKLVGDTFCLNYLPAQAPRLGITVSAKFGSAPERNRFKRRMREAFRQGYPTLPPYEFNVVPRQRAKEASSSDLLNELRKLLKCN